MLKQSYVIYWQFLYQMVMCPNGSMNDNKKKKKNWILSTPVSKDLKQVKNSMVLNSQVLWHNTTSDCYAIFMCEISKYPTTIGHVLSLLLEGKLLYYSKMAICQVQVINITNQCLHLMLFSLAKSIYFEKNQC
jgi:hypothetical protein